MKNILITILTIVLCSCKDEKIISYSLPLDKDIDEIIETIIISDSIPVLIFNVLPDTTHSKVGPDIFRLPIRNPFCIDLEKLHIFFPNQTNDTFEPPPPPPGGGINFLDILYRGQIGKNNIFTTSDSAYFAYQNDTLKHFTIKSRIVKKIYTTTIQKQENKTDTYFSCSIPIFSKDKTKAYVELTYNCYGLCGSASSYILEKTNSKWTIIQRRTLWIS